MENLNLFDIDILVEALTAWEHKNDMGNMLVDMMKTLSVPQDNPEAQDRLAADMAVSEAKNQREIAQRMDTSILLKAKLISLKINIEASNF